MPRKSDVKHEIFEVWDANHDLRTKEIQGQVIERLGKKRSKGGTYPGLRLVQRYVQEFRNNLGQLVDEDGPWSIGASVKYGLPPEANKNLFDIWRASLAMGSPLSIRQAKWLIHIRNLFYEPVQTGNSYSDKVNKNLWLIRQSWLYSLLERASQIKGEKYFDTTNLDAASFMFNWEHATALKLSKISTVNYSQEALNKLEKFGTSLTSPPISVVSVEDAVWHNVRIKPPDHMELVAEFPSPGEVLPEEDDLVAAYWLTHLSKGPLWNNLPEQPDIKARLQYFRQELQQQRTNYEKAKSEGKPHMWIDSGGWPDDSLYSRQRSVRRRVLDWVRTDLLRRQLLQPVRTGSFIETRALSNREEGPGDPSPPFNAALLKTVGYEVTPEQMDTWLKLHEKELCTQHRGFLRLPKSAQKRFVHDEQTPNDKEELENEDYQVALEFKKREEELIELVEKNGSPPKGYKIRESFWASIRDEWLKKYPEYEKKSSYGYVQGQEMEAEYKRLKASRLSTDAH
jgi:hypothetical protein